MCGIAGFIGPHADRPGVNRRALDLIAHRGPDGEGSWLSPDAQVWLGHRRLSIIDLSDKGAQPMHSRDGRFVLVFNGEIYNYVELRAELRAMGAEFLSDSDSEVIIEGYRLWGDEMLARLNGMFAFALLDRRTGRLLCARDRYGEKPFQFVAGNGFFAFASEYKSLLAFPEVRPDYDEMRLVAEAVQPGTGADCDRRTVFNDISQLLPGEALSLDVASFKVGIWKYYSVAFGPDRQFADPREAMTEFRDLFVDSVRIRMRSDVTVGSCLSGGLDSSAIVGIARHLLGADAPYHTFTGRFPGTPADEWSYASEAIAANRVISHVVEPTVERFMDDLPAFMWHNELPVGSSSQFAQWCVFGLAKEHGITVLLDGQGADELLGGYEQYFALYLQSLEERGNSARLAAELPAIRERYPAALVSPSSAWRDRLPLGIRHMLADRLNKGSDIRFGIQPGLGRHFTEGRERKPQGSGDSLRDALHEDSFGRFLTTLLRYGDRNSMAHSREVRLPFCDHRLAEFVFSLPPEYLMGEVQTKRLLRESLREFLPERIATRWNKQGFRPPQDLWFTAKPFLALVRDTLSTTSFRQNSIWRHGWWHKALDRIEAGETGLAWQVWQPFICEMWKTHFVERVTSIGAAEAPSFVPSLQTSL
jgi:asparagine synthase (glutamine-hydrolysing)